MRGRFEALAGWEVVASCLLAACTTGALPQSAGDQRLRDADRDSANWLMHGRTYDEQRFSPLQQINESTVKRRPAVDRDDVHTFSTRSAIEPRRWLHRTIVVRSCSWTA
jgi:hypothetical protein